MLCVYYTRILDLSGYSIIVTLYKHENYLKHVYDENT